MTLPVRRFPIDWTSLTIRRHWNGGNAYATAYCNTLSMSFPVGEQFFIDAVRAGKTHLPADTPLETLQTIDGFIGQESTHRFAHSCLNSHLAEHGLVNHWERWIAWRLKYWRGKQRANQHLRELALTAAYEHLTATLAHHLLKHVNTPKDLLNNADEPLRSVWLWHAAEGLEHKSVAFDLYHSLGGTTTQRLLWGVYAFFLFVIESQLQTLINLWHDKTLFKTSTWLQGLRYTFGRYGLAWALIPPRLAYLHPRFHPYRHSSLAEDRALIQRGLHDVKN